MHVHVNLLAGHSLSGKPTTEMVPAEELGPDLYRISATPGLVAGCAEGDTVKVAASGEFTVVARGGQVAVQIFGRVDLRLVEDLRRIFEPLGGKAESPNDGRFVVVTVPVTAGFPAIEQGVTTALNGREGIEWYFGNVYDERDEPLNWWAES